MCNDGSVPPAANAKSFVTKSPSWGSSDSAAPALIVRAQAMQATKIRSRNDTSRLFTQVRLVGHEVEHIDERGFRRHSGQRLRQIGAVLGPQLEHCIVEHFRRARL